jgi:hypothetical protein
MESGKPRGIKPYHVNRFAWENMKKKRRLVLWQVAAYLTHFIIYVEKYANTDKIPI